MEGCFGYRNEVLPARLVCSEGQFSDTEREKGECDPEVSQLSLTVAHTQIAGAAAASSRSRRPRRQARQPRSSSPRRTCTTAGTARYTRLVWRVLNLLFHFLGSKLPGSPLGLVPDQVIELRLWLELEFKNSSSRCLPPTHQTSHPATQPPSHRHAQGAYQPDTPPSCANTATPHQKKKNQPTNQTTNQPTNQPANKLSN